MRKRLKIYSRVREYLVFAILTPIMMIGEVFFELEIPSRVSILLDYLRDSTEIIMGDIIKQGLVLVGISLLSLTTGILGGVFAAIASSGFAKNLKADMFRKISAFSFKNIDKYSSSSLITRMTTDTNWIQMSFQMTIRMLFRSPVMFIYALFKAYSINTDITSIFLIAIPIVAIALVIIHLGAHPFFEGGIKKIDEINEVVEENVRGVRVVKSFTREKEEISKFDKVNNSIYNFFLKGNIVVSLMSPLMMFAMYTVLLLVVVFGTQFIVTTHVMTSGQLFSLITYTTNILTSLMMLSMIFVFFVISKPSVERVYEVLTEEPSIKNPENPVVEVQDGSIEFKNVSFRYDENSEKKVLDDINLSIKSGEVIGILGATGSSKTTLVSLIPRLYEVTEGEVLIGGKNVKEYDLKVLRDAVSIVLQKNVLFSGSVKDNLRWGNKEATDEEIIEAAKIAQADSFIEPLPDKYDTYVEQGGSNFSGGQKQRLCIARAILKHPKVLIFDDSMSAVDSKTDALIREGLKNYMPSVTKLIIAQRCNSVENADRIIIIDEGKIVSFAPHAELLKTSTIYQELYYTQNKEVERNA